MANGVAERINQKIRNILIMNKNEKLDIVLRKVNSALIRNYHSQIGTTPEILVEQKSCIDPWGRKDYIKTLDDANERSERGKNKNLIQTNKNRKEKHIK